MPKNPFMSCKSRKRRKTRAPVSEPKIKLYCPRTMVRYDNTVTGFYTIWTCKMCLKSLLSEEATRSHVLICNTRTNKVTPTPQPKKEDVTHYVCGECNRIFSRSVTLKRHLEDHKKSYSGLESEESGNEMVDVKDFDIIEADLIKGEY